MALAAAVLPTIPGASCPPVASVLGSSGLGPVCQVASGVVGSATSQVAGFGVDTVLNALGSWVSSGAVWLLSQVGRVLADTTGIDLGASWFTAHYETMVALCGVVIVPLLLLGIIQSIYRQSASMLVRSVVVNVPLALLLTAVAVKLVQLGLALTDAMSAAVAHGAGLDTGHFMATVTLGLGGTAVAQPSAPSFVVFLGGIAVVIGAVMVWIELLIRAAAVYVAVLFLPLALASLAWPAIAHWCRRLVDTLAALILGKFVIVSVLSLAAGALAGGTGSTPGAGSGSGGGGSIAAVLGGAALLVLAGFAPWALFRLLPFLEAGAVGHLEGLGHRARQTATAPVKGLAMTAMRSHFAAAGGAGSMLNLAGGGSGSSPGGSSSLTTPGGPDGPRGDGPTGVPPDPGPSSAQTTGVGTVQSPGHGIPAWQPNAKSTAAARRLEAMGPWEESVDPPAGIRPPSPGLTPLPRQTAARHHDWLGHDRLGPKLISAPIAPPPVHTAAAGDAGGDRGK